MRRTWIVVAFLATTCLGSAPWSGRASCSELGAGYSILGVPAISGWDLSWTTGKDRPVGLVVNAAGYYAYGTSGHLLGLGLQLRQRGKEVVVFEQVVFAGALLGGEPIEGVVIYPGIGVDLMARRSTGIRLKADWPLIIVSPYGTLATTQAPRLTAALVFRPKPAAARPSTRAPSELWPASPRAVPSLR